MSPTLKALLFAIAFLVGSAILAIGALLTFAFTAGPSIVGGERAALFAAAIDILVAVIAVAFYWSVNRELATMPRILATGLFGTLECLQLGLLFLFTLVLLNR